MACRVLQKMGAVVTSRFGNRTDPITGKAGEFHKGVDIVGTGYSTDFVVAHTGGVVEISKYSASAGNYVAIRVSPKCVMRYLHLRELPKVTVGQTVSRGDVLGYMGTTGASAGVHLHFDICEDGQYVDPEPYLYEDYLTSMEENEEETEVKYKTISDVPQWYRPTIDKLISLGAIQGTGDGELNISEDVCKVLTILDRLGKI